MGNVLPRTGVYQLVAVAAGEIFAPVEDRHPPAARRASEPTPRATEMATGARETDRVAVVHSALRAVNQEAVRLGGDLHHSLDLPPCRPLAYRGVPGLKQADATQVAYIERDYVVGR
jgi:hypothetical protein